MRANPPSPLPAARRRLNSEVRLTFTVLSADYSVTARLLPRGFGFDASDEQLVVNKAVEEVVPFLG